MAATKVKYTPSRDTLRNLFEHELIYINYKKQDYKTDTVCGGYKWEGEGG
jgi:hypothetical protein